MMDAGRYDVEDLIPEKSLEKQEVLNVRSQAIDGFASKVKGAGSTFTPDQEAVQLYEENRTEE